MDASTDGSLDASWNRISGEIVYDAGVFRVRRDLYEFRGAPAGHPFHVIEARPWVNVVAVTPDGHIVLVHQYRHGIREICLEVPGGVMDPDDASPAAAAARELLEETGYASASVREIGVVSSNPAILTNQTHIYLVEDARRVAEPNPDAHEELRVELVAVADVRARIQSGEIHHALSVCALAYFLWRDQPGDT